MWRRIVGMLLFAFVLATCGTPEEIAACNESYTGRFLAELLRK